MKKIALLPITILSLLFSCEPPPSGWGLIQLGSTMGVVMPFEVDGEKTGGAALLAAGIEKVQSQEPELDWLTLGWYNMIHGTPEAFFTQGKAPVELYEKAGLDAILLGVREFYFGQEALYELIETSSMRFLSANILTEAGEFLPGVEPYILLNKNKTAIIGLSPDQVLFQNFKEHIQGLQVIPSSSAVERLMPELEKAGVEEVIIVTPYSWDGSTNLEGSPLGALSEIPGVTVLLTGSAQPELTQGVYSAQSPSGKTIEIQVAESGQQRYGQGFYSLVAKDGEKILHYQDVNTAYLEPSQSMANTLHQITDDLNSLLDSNIGENPYDLEIDFNQESSMGNWITDILRDYYQVDAFLLNSGKIRSGLSPGPITRRQIYEILPFGGNAVVVEMTGAQILEVLEFNTRFYNAPELGRGFLQVSGLRYTGNLAGEVNQKIDLQSVSIAGKSLDPGETYRIGLENYMFTGGDGYALFADWELEPELVDSRSFLSIVEEVVQGGSLSSPTMGRILLR